MEKIDKMLILTDCFTKTIVKIQKERPERYNLTHLGVEQIKFVKTFQSETLLID